jgi:hypothetical protein
MLKEAGFAEARIHGPTGYRTSSFTYGVYMTARKPGIGSTRSRPSKSL